jgi:hypothetical protein
LQKRLDLGPARAGIWWKFAVVLVALGDHDGYRNLCEKMLDEFAANPFPIEVKVAAWGMVIAPGAVEDKEAALRLAERGLSAEKTSSGVPVRAAVTQTHGAWLYRVGRYDEAIAQLSESEASRVRGDGFPIAAAYNWCFLAMAHHRLGNTREARVWSKKVYDWQETQPDGVVWHEQATTTQLVKEMEEAFNSEP